MFYTPPAGSLHELCIFIPKSAGVKRTPLLITLSIVVLTVGGYLVYEKFLKEERLSPWSLVPEDAVLVYESGKCGDCIRELTQTTIWRVVEAAMAYKRPIDSLRTNFINSLAGENGYLISVHVTKKDEFEAVYYFPGHLLQPSVLGDKNYRIKSRELNGFTITEFSGSHQTLSVAVIGNVGVASFVPFLLENVIRTHTDAQRKNFRDLSAGTPSFATIRDDAGNVHLQLNKLSDLIGVFTGPHSTLDLSLGKFTLLDVRGKETSLVMNGFSIDTTSGRSTYLLSVFDHQSPVSFGLKQLVSNRTVAMKSFGVTDGDTFAADLGTYVARHNRRGADSLMRLASATPGTDELVRTIGDEFGICLIESSRGTGLSRVLLIESTAPNRWLSVMNQLSDQLSTDTVFYERYSSYVIREVPVFRFPEKLLWPFVSGFDQSFYTSVGNVILIGDDLEDLKAFLNDIEAEETWGKSVSVNRFLESTLLESNINLYVNGGAVWSALLPHLQPKWQQFVQEKRPLLQALDFGSFQFSHLNNNFYTNVLMTYRPFDESLTPVRKDRTSVNFDFGLQRLYPVKSHVTRGNEILLQDSLNDLRLLSVDGKVLWKLAVGDPIVSEVVQVDFYNNGKLQYFFTTRDAFHLIDRLGNYVENYPIHLKDVEIEQVSVIDYDNSKNYRFMVADKDGRMWMYDKWGNNLEGWTPRDGGGALVAPPRHHRIKGRDVIVAIRKDGHVLLYNRRGEMSKDFPINMGVFPSGDYYLDIGSTLADSWFVFVSEDGFKMRFNPEGETQPREALVRTSALSTFTLIREKSNKSYVIVQQDGRTLAVMDQNGNRIVSNNLAGINAKDIGYVDFGAGKRFIVIADVRQRMGYVYDGHGQLLTIPPLEGHAVDISMDNSGQFVIFLIQGKALVVQPL